MNRRHSKARVGIILYPNRLGDLGIYSYATAIKCIHTCRIIARIRKTVAVFCKLFQVFSAILPKAGKNVVIITVIAAVYFAIPCYFCRMRKMIRCGPFENGLISNFTTEHIVYKSTSLRPVIKGILRQKHIVINQIRSVANLHHNIAVVGIIQIGGYAASLGLPIEPRAKGAVMDIVFIDDCVDSTMKFDSCHFMAPEFVFYADIINMVMLDPTENTAQMPNNTILSAIMDLVVPYNM